MRTKLVVVYSAKKRNFMEERCVRRFHLLLGNHAAGLYLHSRGGYSVKRRAQYLMKMRVVQCRGHRRFVRPRANLDGPLVLPHTKRIARENKRAPAFVPNSGCHSVVRSMHTVIFKNLPTSAYTCEVGE